MPTVAAPGEEVAPSTAGTVLRYDARAATLQQRGQLEMVQRGAGQYAEAVVDLTATIEISPANERLKVVWDLGAIENLELRGALQVNDGSDPKAFLLEHGRGAYFSDLRGQAEDDPTLPENAQREAKLSSMRETVQKATEAGTPAPVAPGLQMLSYLPPVVQLPSLPEAPLPLNEPVKVEREEETELGDTGLLLPFYVTMTYTLVNIDTSGGDRLAEMTFTGSAIGSQEGPGGEIVIESQQKGTLLFNLDKQLPVSYESTRTESYEMGQFSGEAETTLRASWDV
ncbi:MAG: hypothetical protein AAGA54_04380 [Myxococcota bacterium]